ncbi:MAG: hypothetical protein BGO98_20380 [Myxococcales bacterium 68-20]|nr:MAG: hypothetical protein BGO98_20380 [Myxococcales bacterium 68-20]
MKSSERELPVSRQEILDRKPGRSFTDPRRPLGEELLETAEPHGGDPEEAIYGRAPEHFRAGHGVPERAKCVAVLRKADELMAENNPPGDTEANQRRALELACGRCGVLIEEYDRLVEADDEVRELEALVLQAAHIRATVLGAESDIAAGPSSG